MMAMNFSGSRCDASRRADALKLADFSIGMPTELQRPPPGPPRISDAGGLTISSVLASALALPLGEVAQAADYQRDRPDGLDDMVEQGGTNLSGGPRQRIAIARALVRRPEIYLFDDSFSALDLATDARLRAALVPYVAGAPVLIVAQRVSTIATADQIVVLEDGAVVGIGTHSELLESCPTYVEIAESQVAAEAAA